MRWIDLAGPPGSGKSTLADPIWGPHELPIEDRAPPEEWERFVRETTRLFYLIASHPTFEAAVRMNNRSFRKMATVYRSRLAGPYIQTGFVQRGLGFGWRLQDLANQGHHVGVHELRRWFELMPVSLGVAFTNCPQEVVIERNRAREEVKATAHENRSHMVPLMQSAIVLAKEVFNGRGVPVLEIDTSDDPETGRQRLRDFVTENAAHAAPHGPGGEMEALQAPFWWVGQRCREGVSLARQ